MAFGVSPKYTTEFSIEDHDSERFLVLAADTINQLGWNLHLITNAGLIAYTKISWSSWSEQFSIEIQGNKATLKSECNSSQLVDWGKNKRNVDDFLIKLAQIRESSSADALESRRAELQVRIASASSDQSNVLPLAGKDKFQGFTSFFIPTEGYVVTPVVMYLNVAVYIMMVAAGVHFFLPENQSLLDWGANFRSSTLDGEWWRLLTCCFVHIGILHLLLNMYALIYIGVLLEPIMGSVRFLSAYILTGVAASVTSIWWHDITISAGASGAIFGMYGVFLALLTTNLLHKSTKQAFATSIAVFVGYNIITGLRPDSGVDNAAHIGGLLSGLVVGYFFVPSLKKPDNNQLTFGTIGSLLILFGVLTWTSLNSMPNDIGQYEKEMEKFVSAESMALEVFNLPAGTPDEEILTELKDRGIYYWNQNIQLIDNLSKLDLPLAIRTRNVQLREYCELRIKTYELIYKGIEEGTNKYEEELKKYNEKIERLIASITKQGG